MKQQIVRIHGGEVRENYLDYSDYVSKISYNPEKAKRVKWSMTFSKDLGETYEVFQPDMPNKYFAEYKHWKTMFEKVFPYLRDDVILIGHSLGGAFLLKYLNENDFPFKIKMIILLAPAIRDIPGDLIGTFSFDYDLQNFKKYENITIIKHSRDDDIVPFSHFEELTGVLKNAEQKIYNGKKHFLDPTFPELLDYIREIR